MVGISHNEFGVTTQQFFRYQLTRPKPVSNDQFFAAKGAYQPAAKTMERPQLSLTRRERRGLCC
jgi:hypothetical protein